MKKFLIRFAIITFFANWIWEILQMHWYIAPWMSQLNPFLFVLIHGFAAVLDALLVVGLFFIASSIVGSQKWVQFKSRGWILYIVLLVGLQWVLEYFFVNELSWWKYSAEMPLLAGVGILPLLQMLILPPLSAVVSNYL